MAAFQTVQEACQILSEISRRSPHVASFEAVHAIHLLCECGVEVIAKMEPKDVPICSFCCKEIEHAVYLESRILDCGHEVHRTCLRSQLLERRMLRPDILSVPTIQCGFCRMQIHSSILEEVIGALDLHRSFAKPKFRSPSPQPAPHPAQKKPRAPPATFQPPLECVQCKKLYPANSLFCMQCEHRYCKECLTNLVDKALAIPAANYNQPSCEVCGLKISEPILFGNFPQKIDTIETLRVERVRSDVALGIIQ